MALNCSQLMSSMTWTGARLGAELMSFSSRRWRASSRGTYSARVCRVASGSIPLSRATISRKFGRLAARIAPLRSTMMPRGAGMSLKLNWLEVASFS